MNNPYKNILNINLVENPDVRFVEKWKQAIKYNLWERFCSKKTKKNEKLASQTLKLMEE